MSDTRWSTSQLQELVRDDGWAPIRRALGVRSFGINAWTAAGPGDPLVPEHDEVPSDHEELYVVIAGHATFTVDGETVDAPQGTIVLVRDPAIVRSAVSAAPDTTILATGGRPGQAFVPMPWETNRDVVPLFSAGRYADAKQMLEQALDEYEERGYLLYNLACAESRLGEADAALAHLREAVRHAPELAKAASSDTDLEAIRDDQRFAELLGPVTAS